MPDVPKIVRESIRVANLVPAEHPDPDVLTAFAESSLSQRERADVLEHLSRCGECREILVLALPASEPVPVAALKHSPSRLAWPSMRWAFASAGVLAIALFGFLQYGRYNASTMIARKDAGAAVEARNEQPPQMAEAYSKSTEEETNQSAHALKRKTPALEMDKHGVTSARDAELAKGFSDPTIGGRLAHGPRQIYQQQQSQNVQQVPAAVLALNAPERKQQVSGALAAEVRPPVSDESVQAQASKPDVNSQALDSVVAKNQVSLEPSASDTEVSRAKSAPVPAAPPVQLRSEARSLQILAATPSWTINAGKLQRSFDQGTTWQDVSVISSPDSGGTLETAVADRKGLKDSLKRNKNKKEQSAPLVFRAVAANGPDVWAGGAGATLYHSFDAGAHWSRVVPSSSDGSLTGDILKLEFRDPQNGTIATSTGEVWSTGDNGQTWQKQ